MSEGCPASADNNRKCKADYVTDAVCRRERHLSSDEEHLARRQPFIACHRYHLGNDLFRPVAMATAICMEMMSVPAEG